MIVSKIDPIATLDYLRYKKEDQYLERKSMYVKPSKIADEIIGMLNADGGILVLGVTDNGEIEDLNKINKNELSKFEKLVHEYIKPSARIKLERINTENGELLFLYHVMYDYENLYERKDNQYVYKRISDSNYGPLTNDEINKLLYDKNIRSFEEQECENFDFENDLDIELLEKYKQKMNFDGNIEDLLIKRNLARNCKGKIVIRNSGILLFSKNPDKYIPSAYVRYIRRSGDNVGVGGRDFNVVKDISIEGNIPTVIDETRKILKASFDDYYFLDKKSGIFKSLPEYPEDAWLEGIVNALFHRSYNLQGNCIYINHFDNRMEITNSGPLPAQVTVENIRNQRFSRNPRIGRVLSELGYVRELNEGVNRIYRLMEEYMSSEPKYEDSNDIVKLILENKAVKHRREISDEVMERIGKQWNNYTKTEQLIIERLSSGSSVTISELVEFSGVGDRSIRTYLKKFKNNGIIVRDSEKKRDKNAKYRLLKRSENK